MIIVEVEYIVKEITDYLYWEEKSEKSGKRITLRLRHPKAEGTKDTEHWPSMQHEIILNNPKDTYALGDTLKLSLVR